MELRQPDRARQYSQFLRRLVRLSVRGGRVVEGNVHVTEGQSLSVFLATRRNLASLTEARWLGPDLQVFPHLAIRIGKILWAGSLDDALPVAANLRQLPQPRWAEITLDDGTLVQASLHVAEGQRLTDYFDAAPPFLPVAQSVIAGNERLLGPIAINTDAILAIREIQAKQ